MNNPGLNASSIWRSIGSAPSRKLSFHPPFPCPDPLEFGTAFSSAISPSVYPGSGFAPPAKFLLCKFQCCVERIHALFDLDGFGEIAEEPRVQAHLDVAGHGIGAEGNDGDVRRGRV